MGQAQAPVKMINLDTNLHSLLKLKSNHFSKAGPSWNLSISPGGTLLEDGRPF